MCSFIRDGSYTLLEHKAQRTWKSYVHHTVRTHTNMRSCNSSSFCCRHASVYTQIYSRDKKKMKNVKKEDPYFGPPGGKLRGNLFEKIHKICLSCNHFVDEISFFYAQMPYFISCSGKDCSLKFIKKRLSRNLQLHEQPFSLQRAIQQHFVSRDFSIISECISGIGHTEPEGHRQTFTASI